MSPDFSQSTQKVTQLPDPNAETKNRIQDLENDIASIYEIQTNGAQVRSRVSFWEGGQTALNTSLV